MRGRLAALVMAVLVALYIVLVADRAVRLIASGVPVGVVMGVALLLLPVLAAYLLARELIFGFRTERLVRRLRDEGPLPGDDLPRHPSGRAVREAADADFPRWRDAVERHPESWQAWFRLGLAYDAAGDRRRARQALRTAIRRHRGAAD